MYARLPRVLRSCAPARSVSTSCALQCASFLETGEPLHGPRKLVFLGAPGVGKGTFANMLAPLLGVPEISTGDLIRTHIKSDSALGREMKVRASCKRGAVLFLRCVCLLSCAVAWILLSAAVVSEAFYSFMIIAIAVLRVADADC